MITIKKNRIGYGLKSAVEELTGVDGNVCLQCKKCSSGCPVAKLARTRPSEIMRMSGSSSSSDVITTCRFHSALASNTA